MILLHATRKLFERLPLGEQGLLEATPRSEWLFEAESIEANPLSGWHGNVVTYQRRNCLLLVNDETRFPLFLPALTKPDFAELNDRFVDALMNTLLKCGADQDQLDAAQRLLRPLQIDTLCNRSAQATLNRMSQELEHALHYDNINVAEITGYRQGAWLAQTPRNVKGQGVLWPQKAMLELLSGLAQGSKPQDDNQREEATTSLHAIRD
ncbi:DUF6933 domain-containing protein [Motiliproteus sediminis]|uniref:DUF6933 domain-containing protein n=1 Tax=Motiliproteus sediminis TaxID=1468178 RepID=UPI001AEF509F|nr:hypothetical protein [Motiliproteus sediminis]